MFAPRPSVRPRSHSDIQAGSVLDLLHVIVDNPLFEHEHSAIRRALDEDADVTLDTILHTTPVDTLVNMLECVCAQENEKHKDTVKFLSAKIRVCENASPHQIMSAWTTQFEYETRIMELKFLDEHRDNLPTFDDIDFLIPVITHQACTESSVGQV